MKKLICMFAALLIFLCGCSQDKGKADDNTFTVLENGNILSPEGVEYSFLANEEVLYYIGDLEFLGSIDGEPEYSKHIGYYQTGMFAIQNAANDHILIRRSPNSEWFAIYRKASLPEFDYSVDNCQRLSFVSGFVGPNTDFRSPIQSSITDPTQIASFLSTVRAQPDPREAGLYELIKKPDGFLENCYLYGTVYAFFEEEPDLVVKMDIFSFNDLAYSIEIEGKEYVLSEHLLEMFE